jgi:competence protein ComEA
MMSRSSAVAIVFAAAALTSSLGLVARQELPEGEGRALTLQLCSNECHGIEKVVAERKSNSQWIETMETMRTDGAKGSDEEFKIIVTYLATHYGVQVRINRATPKQIDDVLVLAEGQAEVIVKYRDEHGPFADWAALMRVPGLDAKKLDVQKVKVVF